MAILLANIGNSNISVEMEIATEQGNQKYFIPIGFDRNEPNEKDESLNASEAAAWHRDQRNDAIRAFAKEIGSKTTSFRDLTAAIKAAYPDDPQAWQSRIRITRIWGVIRAALRSKHRVDQVCLFVTDQPNQHASDTVNAFDIIQLWLAHCREPFLKSNPQLTLKKCPVPAEIAAIDEDKLLDYYYQILQGFDLDEVLFVSVKGGTPQMQTALKIQAIAADFKTQIFLEPQLSVQAILKGTASDCKSIAYWRYHQTQRYAAVRQLLDRWDFDGAVVLLRSWRETLQSLIDSKVTDDKHELQDKRDAIVQAVIELEVAIDCFSLDQEAAQKRFKHKRLDKANELPFKATVDKYDLLQNLYAQCKIYQESRQVPNFLARMGSFYEASQLQLLEDLGRKYLRKDKAGRLFLLAEKLFKDNLQLWNKFLEKHRLCNEIGMKYRDWSGDKKYKLGYQWNFDYFNELELKGRFIRQSLLEALVEHQYSNGDDDRPKLTLWSQLDFWYDYRNRVIHGSEGINEDKMKQLLKEQARSFEAKNACKYEEILPVMQDIMRQVDIVVSADDYYIYSQIKKWALYCLK